MRPASCPAPIVPARLSILRRGAVPALAGVLALTAASMPAFAQDRNQLRNWCNGRATVEQRIQGCDAVLADKDASERDRKTAYNNRGATYVRVKDYDRAIADMTQAILLPPHDARDATLYDNRGTLYAMRGDLDRALEDFDAALRLNPAMTKAYLDRADIYERRGDFIRAMGDYGTLLGIDPDNGAAKAGRDKALAAHRAAEDARRAQSAGSAFGIPVTSGMTPLVSPGP